MHLIDRKAFIQKLRLVPLRNSNIRPYRNAFITLGRFDPAFFSPCQRYVLSGQLQALEYLRWDYLRPHRLGKDIFSIDGYIEANDFGDFGTAQDVLPIIIEEVLVNGKIQQIICDGQHRSFLALQTHRLVMAAYIRGASPAYYAYPLRNGWDDVEIIDEIPQKYIKKFHRTMDYKENFRDFTRVFNNGSVSRSRAIE